MPQVTAEKYLVVDGDNVVHAWPEFRDMLPHDRESAREILVQELAAMHDSGDWRVAVIFDGRSAQTSVDRVGGVSTFVCVRCAAGIQADDVIGKLVSRESQPDLCTVVSADRLVRMSVEAMGAVVITPDVFAHWIQRQAMRANRRFTNLRVANDRQWKRRVR